MKVWHRWVLGVGGVFVALAIAGAMLPDGDETDFSGIDSKELERIINEGIDSKLLEDIVARAPETDYIQAFEEGFIDGYIEDGTSIVEAQCAWDAVEEDMREDIAFWMTATEAEGDAWVLDWFLDGDNLVRLSRCW